MAAKKRAKQRQSAKRRQTRRRAGGARRTTKRVKASRRPARAARPRVSRKSKKPAGRRRTARRRTTKAQSPRRTAPPTPPPAPEVQTARARRPVSPVLLDRERRRLPESERSDATRPVDERLVAAARTGHSELQQSLLEHTETSPKLTAGDVDAKWEDAYAVGDEAPGGDNPTPDQDRVDDIGRALGVQYQDNEELKPEEKLLERDRHRWELDPASSEDWPHKDEK